MVGIHSKKEEIFQMRNGNPIAGTQTQTLMFFKDSEIYYYHSVILTTQSSVHGRSVDQSASYFMELLYL